MNQFCCKLAQVADVKRARHNELWGQEVKVQGHEAGVSFGGLAEASIVFSYIHIFKLLSIFYHVYISSYFYLQVTCKHNKRIYASFSTTFGRVVLLVQACHLNPQC